MLTVIQPPIDFSVLAWVALVPLVLASRPQTKTKTLFLTAYLISLLYWLGNLYWVLPVTCLGWIVFCLYTALLWPILALSIRYCRKKKWPLFLAVPVLVVGVERLQGLFLGGFFWRFLGHSQYQNITLIQIADIFGASGVSFLIAMVNGFAAELIITAAVPQPPSERSGHRIPHQSLPCINFKNFLRPKLLLKTAIVCTAVVAAVAYGRWRIGQSTWCVRDGPLVAVLQSNVPQSVKRSFEAEQQIFDDLMEQSKAAAEAGAELIIWPETMVQAPLDQRILALPLDQSYNCKKFDQALKEHAKDTAYLLIGAYGGKPEIQPDGNVRFIEKFNSAFLYGPDARQSDNQYNKIHLVPFGEVLPFRKTFPWFYNFLMKFKFIPYDYDYSLDYGCDYTVFEMTSPTPQLSIYRFSVMICYEGTVPKIARKFALDENDEKRLHWLVNISNDGWFVRFRQGTKQIHPSAELPQHAAVCAFRAVENRLAVLRSVNTGISCVIDNLGRIRDDYIAGTLPHAAMERTAVEGWLIDKVPIDERSTFFSKYGQWLDFSCAFCVILLIMGPLKNWRDYKE